MVPSLGRTTVMPGDPRGGEGGQTRISCIRQEVLVGVRTRKTQREWLASLSVEALFSGALGEGRRWTTSRRGRTTRLHRETTCPTVRSRRDVPVSTARRQTAAPQDHRNSVHRARDGTLATNARPPAVCRRSLPMDPRHQWLWLSRVWSGHLAQSGVESRLNMVILYLPVPRLSDEDIQVTFCQQEHKAFRVRHHTLQVANICRRQCLVPAIY